MRMLKVNHWNEYGDPNGRVRGRTEGAKENCNPIGKTAMSCIFFFIVTSATLPTLNCDIKLHISQSLALTREVSVSGC